MIDKLQPQIAELSDLIKGRRTVQLFQDRPIPVEQIKEWLDTALWVPNHRMTEAWRFVLIHGEGRKMLAEAAGAVNAANYDKLMAVPMFLIGILKEHPNPVVREEDYASISCVIHNFSLLAWEQGVGMVWKTPQYMHAPGIRDAIGVVPGERIVGIIHVGYPSAVPEAKPRKSVEQVLTEIVD